MAGEKPGLKLLVENWDTLTARQRKVLFWKLRGSTDEEIVKILNLKHPPKYVETVLKEAIAAISNGAAVKKKPAAEPKPGPKAKPGRKPPSAKLLQNRRNYQKKRRHAALAKGLCGRCAKQPVLPGRDRCRECMEKTRILNRESRQKRIDAGLCRVCGKPALYEKTMCREHLEARNAYGKAWHAKHGRNKQAGKQQADEN